MPARSTEEVVTDHLARRARGDLEGDLAANYAEDVVVLSKDGGYRGRDGIRTTAAILADLLPEASFSYDLLRIEDEFALLGWSATAANGARTCQGADSFTVRNGRIAAQTIHYEVKGGSDAGARLAHGWRTGRNR